MTETTRKRAPRKKADAAPTKANGTQEAQAATAGSGDERADALAAAYDAALDARDKNGVIPEAKLEAARNAFISVPKRQRGSAAATLNATAMAKVANKDGTVDTGRVHAVAALASLFNDNLDSSTVAPHDPVPGIAGLIAALDQYRADLLEGLTDEDRERVTAVAVADDDAAQSAMEGTNKALDKVKNRVMNGRGKRGASRGYSGPPRKLGDEVREALQEAEGNRLTFSEVCKARNISNGALIKRWRNDNIDGVRAVGDDVAGSRAFELT